MEKIENLIERRDAFFTMLFCIILSKFSDGIQEILWLCLGGLNAVVLILYYLGEIPAFKKWLEEE